MTIAEEELARLVMLWRDDPEVMRLIVRVRELEAERDALAQRVRDMEESAIQGSARSALARKHLAEEWLQSWQVERERVRTLAQQNAALREALMKQACNCDTRYIKKCLDCGSALAPVPQDTRLNSEQWDSVKAGDFYCSGTCTSDKATSGKRYFRYRELPVETIKQCDRCAILAQPVPEAVTYILGRLAALAEALRGVRFFLVGMNTGKPNRIITDRIVLIDTVLAEYERRNG